jgi:beta-galactosidase/beta-glucuronidase
MESISLNKTWYFKLDPKNKGLEENWFQKPETLKAENLTIKVPSCWEEQEMDYQGVAWYFTEFEVSNETISQVCRLCFAAANYRTSVWINGHLAGTHEGGYTPFYFEIQPFLKYGTHNQITVRIVSPIITKAIEVDGLGPNDMPHWRGGLTAGIWQSVGLEFNKDAWIESAFYQPDLAQSRFKLELTVQSKILEASSIELTVQLEDATGLVAGKRAQAITLSKGTNKIETTIELQNPILWD